MPSLQFVITDRMSLISPLNSNDRSIPLTGLIGAPQPLSEQNMCNEYCAFVQLLHFLGVMFGYLKLELWRSCSVESIVQWQSWAFELAPLCGEWVLHTFKYFVANATLFDFFFSHTLV